jgi:hypothetical protein
MKTRGVISTVSGETDVGEDDTNPVMGRRPSDAAIVPATTPDFL